MTKVLIIIVPIIIGCSFIFVIAMLISPKLRGKMMSRQVKAVKYATDYSKEDLASVGTTLGNVGVQVKKNVLDQNEESLKDMATREAAISKENVEITARAIKEGLTNDKKSCKHCNAPIDDDSKFCKKCGKEQ